ncbi:MAG: hypothetical protein IKJ18_00705 [Bacteroidaceae bacterium]|nr:hypothetical protein [Bacteroidaceae bacterium]
MKDHNFPTPEEKKHILRSFSVFIIIFSLFFLICILLGSCKTVKTVVEYRDHYVHDTTQLVDSIYQDLVHYIYTKGDTVFKTDSVFLYKYKYIDRNIVEYVHDSVPYTVEVEKFVTVRSGYDKFCSWFFWIVVVLVILYVAWWCFKKFYLRR